MYIYVMAHTREKISSLVSLFLTLTSLLSVGAFNLDTKFPVIFSGPPRSYFGYTVAIYQRTDELAIFVGAPTANSTRYPRIYQPGVLYRCDINSTLCEDEYTVLVPPSKRGKVSLLPSYRMWLGATLDVTPNFHPNMSGYGLVVCGHRAVRGSTSVNGLCHIFKTSLLTDSDLLRPLENSDKQFVYDSKDNVYRSYFNNGQLGMSATFSQDGSHLIVGAPGIFEGTGSVFYYSAAVSSYKVMLSAVGVKKTSSDEKHAYFGYSITSGKFFNSTDDQYAVGAPRGENHGKVYIMRTSDTLPVTFLQIEKGLELGEYFGASVLGVNLNGDSFTDLVVGAPLYAHETGCDEGKVTVFISDGNTLNYHSELYGDGKSDARFGTSIASIGDLNADGFGDFAVGAPYEDGKGAVYIYHGSDTGVIAQYSQKIEAAQVHPNLVGFGIHISRGIDIDGNGYPDIVVGSYVSSNAVLLRAQPVINVFASVYTTPPEIKMDNAECTYSGKKLPCVHVAICLNYTGMHVPASLEFHCTLVYQDEYPRGSFLPHEPKNSSLKTDLTLKKDLRMCTLRPFYLHSDIEDIITPIPMYWSCDLAPSTAPNDTFDSEYPVVSPYSIKNVTKLIPFHSGCEADVCHPDLIVEAELLGEAKNGSITLGNVSSVSMDISVRNEGEPAYLSELLIYLPPEIPIISKDLCVTRNEPGQEIIACDLGNPLVKDKQVNIRIKLDVTKIASHTKFVEIFLEASTNSSETNAIDNTLTISLEVKKISDIGIRGTPSHYLILYQKDHEMSSLIDHRFTVRNYGPSPLQRIDILLQVPHFHLSPNGRTSFLYLIGLQLDRESENILPAACEYYSEEFEMMFSATEAGTSHWDNETLYYNDTYGSTTSSSYIRKRSVEQDIAKGHLNTSDIEMESDELSSRDDRRSFRISCGEENFECVTFRCSASTFSDVRKFSEISVEFEIDYTKLNDYFDKWYQIEFFTTGSISISDHDVLLLSHHSNIALIKTVIQYDGPNRKEIPHWLFSVGAFLGTIVLFQIIIILIKVGFFRRKEKLILVRLEKSFSASNHDEELLIEPSEGSSAEDE